MGLTPRVVLLCVLVIIIAFCDADGCSLRLALFVRAISHRCYCCPVSIRHKQRVLRARATQA